MGILDKNDDAGKLIVRLTIGVLLLLHGISKMQHGVDWMVGLLAAHHLPGFIRFGAYVGEVVAPILVIAGILSRPAGLVIAFNLLMAMLLVHSGDFGSLSQTGGWSIELETLYLLGGVAIWCLGSGKYALSRGKGKWD